MIMQTSRPNLPKPGAAAQGGAPRPRPAERPKPAAAAAAVAPASDFDWDDDELETRLFEGGEDKDIAEANRESDLASARRLDAPGASLGRPAANAPGGGIPRATPMPAAPGGMGAAAMPVGAFDDPSMHVPGRNRGIIIGAAVALMLVVVGLGYMLIFGDDGGEEAATDTTVAKGSLTVNVTPADALVKVGSNVIPGSSPFLVSDLDLGTYKIVASKDGYLPWEKMIEVKTQGVVVPVDLQIAQVTLQLQTNPPGAAVTLIAGDQRVPIGKGGDSYVLTRQPNVSYQVEAAAPGYTPSRLPLALGAQPQQPVQIALMPAAAGTPPAPTPAPTPTIAPPTPTPTQPPPAAAPRPIKPKSSRPRPSKPKKPRPSKPSSSGAAKTATIGVAGAAGAAPATVKIDNKTVGKTPRPKIPVTPGKHTVKCVWPDKTDTQVVSVPDGGKKIVRCRK